MATRILARAWSAAHLRQTRVIKPRLQLVDVQAIAAWCKVAPGTVRRWASQDRWHPYGTRRHRLWDLTEVQASWRKRRSQDNPA